MTSKKLAELFQKQLAMFNENLKPLNEEWLKAYTTKSITQSLAHELDAN